MINPNTHFRITQHLLRKYIVKKFGKEIKIKMCGMTFISNREFNQLRPMYREKIWVISKNELTDDKKEEINDLLLKKCNQIELAISGDSRIEIVNVGLTFISPL